MTYQVLEYFEDLQDLRHPYQAGGTYPRKGYEPSEARIAELCGTGNKRGKAVIKAIEPEVATVPPQEPEQTVVETAKPKRRRRRKDAD